MTLTMTRPYFLFEITDEHMNSVVDFFALAKNEELERPEHVDILTRYRKTGRLSSRQARWILNSYSHASLKKPEILNVASIKAYAELDLTEAWRTDEVKTLKALIKLDKNDPNVNAKAAMLFGLPVTTKVLADEVQTVITVETTGKTCVGCDNWQPYSRFNKHNSAKDGYETKCKTCRYA